MKYSKILLYKMFLYENGFTHCHQMLLTVARCIPQRLLQNLIEF